MYADCLLLTELVVWTLSGSLAVEELSVWLSRDIVMELSYLAEMTDRYELILYQIKIESIKCLVASTK